MPRSSAGNQPGTFAGGRQNASRRRASTASRDSAADLGFEAKLWLAADKLRNNLDAAEYKHVVLGLMNLAIRGIEADLGAENADTFRRDLHADLRADFVLANPPFNDSSNQSGEGDIRLALIDRVHRELTDADLEKITSTYHA